MFSHPLLLTISLSFVLSIAKVLFVDRSFLGFVSQFINFPYWAVLLIFLFNSILRGVRDTRAYKLLHTIYHESGQATRPHLRFTPQIDEFGLNP